MGEDGGLVRLAGGGFGVFVVVPRIGQSAGVDGLPSGQGFGFGQDMGQAGANTGADGVAVGTLDVGDLSAHLVGDDGAAQAAIQQPEIVGVGGKDRHHREVDGGGFLDPLCQFLGLLLVFVTDVSGGEACRVGPGRAACGRGRVSRDEDDGRAGAGVPKVIEG